MKSAGFLVIAECGVNHNGSRALALELVDCAAELGADAVKFQTFKSEALVSRRARKAEYQLAAVGGEDSQFEMLAALELSEEDHLRIRERCEQRKVEFMSTPFDEASADLLERLGVQRFKIGSGDLTHLPLLRHIAAKGRPVIASTGMSTLGEVEQAVGAMTSTGNRDLSLLHCVTQYPAPIPQVNLRAMATLRQAFHLPVGYSDHTLGNETCVAAVALGAEVIEKHLTLDQSLPGPDHRASADPREFAQLIKMMHNARAALGDGIKRPAECELGNRDVARRSLIAARALPIGSLLSRDALVIKRPGTGIQPADLDKVLGRVVRVDIEVDEPITWDMLK